MDTLGTIILVFSTLGFGILLYALIANLGVNAQIVQKSAANVGALLSSSNVSFSQERLNKIQQDVFNNEDFSELYLSTGDKIVVMRQFIAQLKTEFDDVEIRSQVSAVGVEKGEKVSSWALVATRKGSSVVIVCYVDTMPIEAVHLMDRKSVVASWLKKGEFATLSGFRIYYLSSDVGIKQEIFQRILETSTVRHMPPVPVPSAIRAVEYRLQKGMFGQLDITPEELRIDDLSDPALHYPNISIRAGSKKYNKISGDKVIQLFTQSMDASKSSYSNGDRNYNIILNGIAGAGKTSLLNFLKVAWTKAGHAILNVSNPSHFGILFSMDGESALAKLAKRVKKDGKRVIILLDNWDVEDIKANKIVIKNAMEGAEMKKYNLSFVILIQKQNVGDLGAGFIDRAGRVYFVATINEMDKNQADQLAELVSVTVENADPRKVFDRGGFEERLKVDKKATLDTVYSFVKNPVVESTIEQSLLQFLDSNSFEKAYEESVESVVESAEDDVEEDAKDPVDALHDKAEQQSSPPPRSRTRHKSRSSRSGRVARLRVDN
jgi:hypothetical protein